MAGVRGARREQLRPILGTKEGISFRDRLSFGAIAAFLGALLGVVLALVVWLAMLWLTSHARVSIEPPSFKWSVVAFVSGFFFFAGFVRGARAGDLLGEAATVTAIAAIAPIAGETPGPAIDGELTQTSTERADRRGAAFLWHPAWLLTLLAGVLMLGLFGPW